MADTAVPELLYPGAVTAEWHFPQLGSPQTGLGLWGASKCHFSPPSKEHVISGTALMRSRKRNHRLKAQ